MFCMAASQPRRIQRGCATRSVAEIGCLNIGQSFAQRAIVSVGQRTGSRVNQFTLQRRRRFASLGDVRWRVTICFTLALLSAAQAQEQERKLVDRLLKPNTTLQNSAQNKKAVAAAVVVEGRGTVGTFYLQPKSREKSFPETRDFSTRTFTSR